MLTRILISKATEQKSLRIVWAILVFLLIPGESLLVLFIKIDV